MSQVQLTTIATELMSLVGKQLSAVTFIHDYWQLNFDEGEFAVFSHIAILGSGQSVRDGEDGFRDRLVERIGQFVTKAEVEDDCIRLTFDDQFILELSTRAADYRGPEALTFRISPGAQLFVI